MLNVNLFNESGIKYLPKKRVNRLIERTLKNEGIREGDVNVVYFNDEDIESMNIHYLGHHYPTDVISFKLDEEPLLAEIYIGAEVADRRKNEFKVSLSQEIARYAVHGALHVAGYDDKTDAEKNLMKNLENKYLDLYYV
jgi:rRNA maturation RNase YbeY